MKKVLVTGGFGFIGSHLIEGLLEDPNTHVHVVDNLSSNPIPHQRLLEELDNPERLTYTICSVEQFCDKYWTAYNFNEIYHLASVVGPAGVIEHIGRMATSIVDDTYNIIKIALSYGARLLDVSTSEVYGGGVEGYCSEDMHSVITQRYSARLEYAVAKLASEIIRFWKTSPRRLSTRSRYRTFGQQSCGRSMLPVLVSPESVDSYCPDLSDALKDRNR